MSDDLVSAHPYLPNKVTGMAEVRYSILTYLRVGVPKVASLTPIRFFVLGPPRPSTPLVWILLPRDPGS